MPSRSRPGRRRRLIEVLLAVVALSLLLLPPASTTPLIPRSPVPVTSTPTLVASHGLRRGASPSLSTGAPLQWVNLSSSEPTAPGPRGNYGIAYDSSLGYTVLFGGLRTRSTTASPIVNNDTWQFLNGTWRNITSTAGTPPAARYDMSMAYDPVDQEVVLFGGYQSASGYLNDTWVFQNGSWSELSIGGPSPRYEAGLVWDAADQALLLFGGAGSTYLNDTWEFAANTWTQLQVTGDHAPPPRREAALAYDSADNETVLFGGVDSSFTGFNDTWTFANDTWTQVSGGTAPSPRWAVDSVADPAVSGVVLFGGCASQGCGTTLNDTWTFSNGNWSELSGFLTVPRDRGANPMAYETDGAGGVADVLFLGGSVYGGNLNDTWVFTPAIFAGLRTSASRVDAGEAMTFTTTVAGGTRPLSYVYRGLPAGCATANRSALACTPNASGNVTVTVNVTDPYGSYQEASTALTVLPSLGVNLSSSRPRLEVGQAVTFTANVSGGDAPYAYSYLGLPMGCGSSDQTSLTCRPTATGAFNVSVRVTDAQFSATSSQLHLLIDPALGASATLGLAESDAGEAVWLNGSVASGPSPWNFTWAGLPCGAAWGPTVRCVAPTPGTFYPSVMVTDADGATANLSTSPWVVVADPTVNFSASHVQSLTGTSVTLQATATGGVGPYSFSFQFGDGSQESASVGTVVHTYAVNGTYVARVTVTDHEGFTSTAEANVTVVVPLDVALSASVPEVTVGGAVTLRATTIGGAAPLTPLWSALPPGCVGTAALSLSCAPTVPGAYTVHVTVTDALGENPTATVDLLVKAPAVVTVTATSGAACVPVATTFVGQITSGGTAPFRYSWSFGDGTTATGASAAHTFRTAGNYTVQLTVEDASNVSANASYTFTAEPAGTCATLPVSNAGSLLLVAGVGAAVVAAVAAAIVLVRRRRSPPASPDPDLDPSGETDSPDGDQLA